MGNLGIFEGEKNLGSLGREKTNVTCEWDLEIRCGDSLNLDF